ncbi:hypothetical protein OIU78_026961 [Salix suchowensis]|nr:hypothetical protein OIU78_026961 [Salix suchowensis]
MNGGGGGGYGDHDSSDLIADSIPHNIYPWHYVQGHERSNQERDASSLLLPIQPSPPPPPHPFSVHGFDQQQYYHPGQFGSMNGQINGQHTLHGRRRWTVDPSSEARAEQSTIEDIRS